jgi:sterol desaturase/sphingolipid hydroxylase (fatty acid hydroxylase superfamily)
MPRTVAMYKQSVVRRVVRLLAFPITWGGTVVAAWLLLRAGHSPLLAAAVAGTITLAVTTLLEVVMPFRKAWHPRWADLRVDGASFAAVAWGLSGLTAWMAPALVAVAADVAAITHAPTWPGGWPVALQIALAVLLSQLVSYAWHLAHHRVPLLWRLHAMHHSPDKLYWLNASRTHPVEDLGSRIIGSLLMLSLGAPPEVLAMTGVVLAGFGPFQHGNIDLAWGPLDLVLSTGRVHRFHHSTIVAEANANYGSCLLVWDHLFRTFKRFRGESPAALGTGGATPFPSTYLGQVLAPVRWQADYAALAAPVSDLREVGE